ncbi:MAG TPA: PH domain-containing protein [Desulfitobacteriaceae bacterium]|nr:PH domain-containing protein [Desulfitobacteriaceae bacterium]
MRVKSAVDPWINIVIYLTIAIILASTAMVPKEVILIALIIALPTTALIMWIYFGTYYEFRENYLYCKSGPFFEKIPYDKIKSARLSQNILSSMALSSKRIEIRQHGKGYILGTTMISPINREEFLAQLIKKCRYIDQNN